MIDTGGGEQRWAEIVKSTLAAKGIVLSHVLITHFHGDHSGGIADVKTMYPHLEDSVYKNEPERGQQPIEDDDVFAVEGATIRALHVPGHSTDHMCFVLVEEQAMFTGDNVLGHGTSAIEDLWVFMQSLKRMGDQRCGIGYSAHGCTITDLPGKIAGELSTKLRRERQVMQALERIKDRGERGAVVGDIVSEIYGNSLDEQTRAMALEPFIDEVLRKLAADGRVAFAKKAGLKRWFSIEQRGKSGIDQSWRPSANVSISRSLQV